MFLRRYAWLASLSITLFGCDRAPDSDNPRSNSTPSARAEQVGLGSATGRSPNILVIMWDTVRADRLGCYGYDRDTTPNIDRFATEARVYERVVSPSNWTVPSHAAIFTGRHPTVHGAIGREGLLGGRFHTVAERLREAGYGTFLFSTNPFVSATHNLTQGFEVVEYAWEEDWASRISAYARSRPTRGRSARTKRSEFKDAGPIVSEAVLQWLDGRTGDRPFFAFLNFMEAHWPWYPTREERDRFLPPDLVKWSYELNQSYARRYAHSFGVERYQERDLAVSEGLYDAALWRLDQITGDLLAELARRGLVDNTVIVLVSDHGDSLGEHGRLGHEYSLYNTLLRVPLIIRYPPLFPPGRVTIPIQTTDLYPTLLEVAGITGPVDRGASAYSLLQEKALPRNGRALIGEYLRPKPTAVNLIRSRYPSLETDLWMRALRSIELDDYKLIWGEDGRHELFDLSVDPGERTNLFRLERERAAELLDRLGQWVESAEREPLAGGEPPDRAAFSPQERERLAAIGYFEDEVQGAAAGDDDDDESEADRG